MKKALIIITTVLFLSNTLALGAPDDEINDELIKRTYSIAIKSNLLLAATTGGLVIYNIASPLAPAIRASITLPGSGKNVVIKDNIAILALGPAGISFIDFTNSLKPIEISRINTEGSANKLFVNNNNLFVADGPFGWLHIDISNSKFPKIIKRYETPGYSRDILFLEQKVFIASDRASIEFYKKGRFGSFKKQKAIDLPGKSRKLACNNNLLFTANNRGALHIFDLANKTPSIVGEFVFNDSIKNLVLFEEASLSINGNTTIFKPGSLLIASTGVDGVNILDIRNPEKLSIVYHHKTATCANDALIHNGVLYVATDSGGIMAVPIGKGAESKK